MSDGPRWIDGRLQRNGDGPLPTYLPIPDDVAPAEAVLPEPPPDPDGTTWPSPLVALGIGALIALGEMGIRALGEPGQAPGAPPTDELEDGRGGE